MKELTLARMKALCPNPIEQKLESKMMGSTLDLGLFGEVEKDSPNSADSFRAVLDKYQDATAIRLKINSIGGSLAEGNSIYQMLNEHPAKVTVHIEGFACSIASVIAMAGEKVFMGPTSMMMIHNPFANVTGNSKELRQVADGLDAQARAVRQAYLLKSKGKLSEEHLIELLDAETFLTAQECIRYGLCDGITYRLGETEELSEAKAEIESLKAELNAIKKENVPPGKGWLF